MDAVTAGIHLREVLGHKEAITNINYHEFCGIISCSMAGYDVKIWDHRTMDLLLVLNQLNEIPDDFPCHPNVVQA
jgi:hypothetical protein